MIEEKKWPDEATFMVDQQKSFMFSYLFILLTFPLYALAHLLFKAILYISSASVYANISSEKKMR